MAKEKKAGPAPKKGGQRSPEGSRELGFMLYMKKRSQGEIAERCNVSNQTVSAWKKADNWEAKRAALEISPESLIAKAMLKASEMLDSDSFNADAFAKALKPLQELKKTSTVADEVTAFEKFQNYLIANRADLHITPQQITEIVRLQDAFITARLADA